MGNTIGQQDSEKENLEMAQQVELFINNVLLNFCKRILISKSPSLYRHSELTGDIARVVVENTGRDFGYTPDEAYTAGVLHDIGKCYLADEIIDKSSRQLNEREWEAINCHPAWGYQILEGTPFDSYAHIILDHHEKLDGSGYPHGKFALDNRVKLIALADQVAAFLDDRPYRRRITLISLVDREIGKITRSLFEGVQAVKIEAALMCFSRDWIKNATEAPYKEPVPTFHMGLLEQLSLTLGKCQVA